LFGAKVDGDALLSFSTLMPEAEFNGHYHPQFGGF
jgi:hypothetical protein